MSVPYAHILPQHLVTVGRPTGPEYGTLSTKVAQLQKVEAMIIKLENVRVISFGRSSFHTVVAFKEHACSSLTSSRLSIQGGFYLFDGSSTGHLPRDQSVFLLRKGESHSIKLNAHFKWSTCLDRLLSIGVDFLSSGKQILHVNDSHSLRYKGDSPVFLSKIPVMYRLRHARCPMKPPMMAPHCRHTWKATFWGSCSL